MAVAKRANIIKVIITLSLDEEEAAFIRSLTQKYISNLSTTKYLQTRVIAESTFNALNGNLPRKG